MLKRPVVSLLRSIKTKMCRHYYVPPNYQNDISLIKKKYDMPKEVLEVIENQEYKLTKISNQLVELKTSNDEFVEKTGDTLKDLRKITMSTFWVFVGVVFVPICCNI